MDSNSKKLINFTEVSEVLTGSRNTIRSNRANSNYSGPMNELFVFLEGWVAKNAKSTNTKITIKSTK